MEALVFEPKIWLAAAAVLVIADMLLGLGNFALAVGVACALLAVVLFGQDHGWFGSRAVLATWRGVAVAFAALAVLSVVALRFVAYGRRPTDINKY